MKNVQISIDEELLARLDRAAKPRGLKRSAAIREAVRTWLARQAVQQFEEQWVAALGASPDDKRRAEDWAEAQEWGK